MPGVLSVKGTLVENVCRGTAVVCIEETGAPFKWPWFDGGELRRPFVPEFVLGLCEFAAGADCIRVVLGVCGAPGGTSTGAGVPGVCGRKYVIG